MRVAVVVYLFSVYLWNTGSRRGPVSSRWVLCVCVTTTLQTQLFLSGFFDCYNNVFTQSSPARCCTAPSLKLQYYKKLKNKNLWFWILNEFYLHTLSSLPDPFSNVLGPCVQFQQTSSLYECGSLFFFFLIFVWRISNTFHLVYGTDRIAFAALITKPFYLYVLYV